MINWEAVWIWLVALLGVLSVCTLVVYVFVWGPEWLLWVALGGVCIWMANEHAL